MKKELKFFLKPLLICFLSFHFLSFFRGDSKLDVKLSEEIGWMLIGEIDDRLEEIESLIKKGADVNALSAFKRTYLFDLVRHPTQKNSEIEIIKKTMEILIENDIDIDARDSFEMTALMEAARLGHAHFVDFLIEKKADVDAIDVFRQNAVTIALISAGDLSSKVTKEEGLTVPDYMKVIRSLVSSEINLGVRDGAGWYPIMYAAKKGNLELAKLLSQGKGQFHLHKKNFAGQRAYEIALKKGYKELAEYLMPMDKAPTIRMESLIN